MTRQRIALTMSLCILWVIIFAATLFMNPPSRTSVFIRFRNSQTDATITGDADFRNHGYVTYQYQVGRQTFTGAEAQPDGRRVYLGDHLPVFYFPNYPQFGTIASVEEQRKFIESAVGAGVILASFTTFLVYRVYFRQS